MTRAYDDIEAVTRLLEEKEKDLELTVQIGKELLAQNTRLENRVVELEGDIKTANENLAQLSYDLHTKSTLLAALTNDEDASASEDSEYLPIVNNIFLFIICACNWSKELRFTFIANCSWSLRQREVNKLR